MSQRETKPVEVLTCGQCPLHRGDYCIADDFDIATEFRAKCMFGYTTKNLKKLQRKLEHFKKIYSW